MPATLANPFAYKRTPLSAAPPWFVPNCQAAHKLFRSWWSSTRHDFGAILWDMHMAYCQGAGIRRPYRTIALVKKDASPRKQQALRLGFDLLPQGGVPLAGIPAHLQPGWIHNAYHYPRLASHLEHRVYETQAGQYLSQEPCNWIELGRIVAGWRPFWKGNWALFSIILSEILAAQHMPRTHLGYLDWILQAATPESLHERLPRLLALGKEF